MSDAAGAGKALTHRPTQHHYATIGHGRRDINESRIAHECGRKVILGRCIAHLRENSIERPFAVVNAQT